MRPSPFSVGRANKRQLNASMNVVPYIDVMLVLLVIFMVTTPMLTTGVDIDLPQAQADNIGAGTQMPVIVSLTDDGALFMTYEDTVDVSVSQSELIEMLTLLQNGSSQDGISADGDISNSNNGVKVMINADQNNQYGNIMQLMADLQQAGITQVGLLTGAPLPES